MAIELHPDAAANLNQRAEALPSAVVEMPAPGPLQPIRTDPVISHVIDASDPSFSARIRLRDAQGTPRAHYFLHQGRCMGLREGEYTEMRAIAETLAKTRQLRELVSVRFLEDILLDWLKARYVGTQKEPMTGYVLSAVEAAVRRYEVWIPVATGLVEEPLSLGRVVLRPLSAEFLEQWQQQTLAAMADASPDARTRGQTVLDQQRAVLQGLTVAITQITAEPLRAREIALATTEDALGLFRWLSPANQEPTAISFCVVRGRERSEGIEVFLVRDGRVQERIEADTHSPRPELISATLARSSAFQTLFAMMTRLLTSETPTEFDAAVLNALLLYSRNALTPDLSEKLTYILAALESVFLKDRSEPVQQNLGERIAFLSETDGSKRRQVVAAVRNIYALRSEFLHHGQSIDDVTAMRAFMKKAHEVMGILLTKVHLYRTIGEFIDAVDDIKFS